MNLPQRIRGEVEITAASIKADDAGNPVPVEIEVMRVGKWDTPRHGSFEITGSSLDEYVDNFKSGVRRAIPIDVEHGLDPVFGKRAVGWVTDLKRAGDSLIATVDWTKTGYDLLKDKAFKFFSPEFAVSGYRDPEGKLNVSKNVLLAGGIVNRPLFKDLNAVMASDGSNQILIIADDKGDAMTELEMIRKKQLNELSDDDKKVLTDNKGELSPAELAAFGLAEKPAAPAPAPAAPIEPAAAAPAAAVAASDKGVKGVEGDQRVISADEFNKLTQAAELGKQAYAELEAKKASDKVDGWVEENLIKAGEKDKVTSFYQSLSDEQRQKFETEVMGSIQTEAVAANDDLGEGGSVIVGGAAEALNAKAEAIMASDKTIKYGQALTQAKKENSDLAKAAEVEARKILG